MYAFFDYVNKEQTTVYFLTINSYQTIRKKVVHKDYNLQSEN